MDYRNKQILNLAVPSIISNITVPLIGLVDLTISGYLGSVAYIGAVAIGSMIFNIIYWIFGFLRMGTSGMTSQALGSRDFSEVMRLLVRSLSVALVIALLFLVLQKPILWLALGVMHPSDDISPLASAYFNICIWGAPAMLCLYGLTGWFIGMQNTRVPMIVSILQNVINIIASFILAVIFDMKIEGVALGTLIAQWCGLAIAGYFFVTKFGIRIFRDFHLRIRNIIRGSFDDKAMKGFFTVNRDIFLRTLFLVAVNLFFVSAGARQGDVILSVNTLLMTLFTVFSYFMDGFAYAAEALSGKYYGAGNMGAFHDTCNQLFKWGVAMVVAFTLLYLIGGDKFLSLLTNQQSVVHASDEYFWWAVLIPVAGVAAFIYDGIFIGITETRGMLISSAVAAIFFFTIFFAMRHIMGNHALWLAFILYLAIRGIIQAIIIHKS